MRELANAKRASRMPGAIPPGDTKVEYRSPEGRNVVLKLKTAPDAGQRHSRSI